LIAVAICLSRYHRETSVAVVKCRQIEPAVITCQPNDSCTQRKDFWENRTKFIALLSHMIHVQLAVYNKVTE